MNLTALLAPRGAGAVALLATTLCGVAHAERIAVHVTVTNLAPTGSVSFAPLHVGFHAGIFDAFDAGASAGPTIVSIAEGGSGSAWFPAFAMSDPNAMLGTVLPTPAGPLLPGASATHLFTIDTDLHTHFSFGSMAVPSNDYFIGNDSPTQIPLMSGGVFTNQSLTLTASDLWDAGSEVDGIFGAAFVAGSMNDDRIPDMGVVASDFGDLTLFNGVTTGAGYVFENQLAADTPIYSITIQRAEPVTVRVTVENLAPDGSVSFAPLRVGFHDGLFDPFDNGEPASAAIISIAEGGSGGVYFSELAGAQPDALLGSVLPNPAGPLLPGGVAEGVGTAEFTIDPATQRYFSFGAMVVPSNDFFIGNDAPTAYDLFDADGRFVPRTIVQRGADIWDAGSELDGAFGAAFLVGSMNDDHIDENGVVRLDVAGLSIFDGLTTAAGYTFMSQLRSESEVYRITISEVPACDADLNADGNVGQQDLAMLLGMWAGSGAADLDGSGAVGMADLSILLGAWGDCG